MQAEQPVAPIDIPQAIQQGTADVNVVPQSTVSSTTTTIAPPETMATSPASSLMNAGTDPEPQVQTVSTIAAGSTDSPGDAIAKEQQRLEQQLAEIVARDRAAQVGQQSPAVDPTPADPTASDLTPSDPTPAVVAPTPVTVSPFPSSEQVEVRLEPRTPSMPTPNPEFVPIAQPPQLPTDRYPSSPTPANAGNWGTSIDLGASGDVGTGASNITPQSTYFPTTDQPQGQMILPPTGGTNSAGLIYPLASPAPITSPFGWRVHPISGDTRMHQGVDYGAPTGTPILAAARGRVDLAGELSGYGSAVVLRHNNDTLETLYGHMSQILVKEGQWVEQGTVIGLVGSTGYSTGPHLHFEVLKPTPDGWVAIDPLPQIGQSVAQQNPTIPQSTAATNQPAPSIQAMVPGNQLTVTALQPTNAVNPATPLPQVVSMSIGLNGVVNNPDPIANLKALGNRLVSFEAKQNNSQLLNPVGVLAPLAFSPPITPKLSSLIAPQLSQPAAQSPVPAPIIIPTTPQIASQEWVTFPPPVSLMPNDSQSSTTTASEAMTNALIPGTTPSSQALSNTQTQASSHRQTAILSNQKTIAARTTATQKMVQKPPAKRPFTQAQ